MNNKQKKKPQPGKKTTLPPGLQQKMQQKQDVVDDQSSSEDEYDPEYEHPDDAEDIEDYKPDGYHPAVLGEKFKDGRYTIIQKLGWGHFSTVWLAHDKETDQNVALKIQKSKKSYQEAAIDEIQLLGDLRKNEKSEKWVSFIKEMKEKYPECKDFDENENYCCKLLDNFVHFGVHGKHYCSTFEILGPNLLDLIQHFDDYRRRMRYWLVKLIARQCLISLVYVHDVCGMIHTDIKPENVMISLNEEYFHQLIDQVKKIEKKPFSMYYLKKLQQKQSKQNAKKDKQKEKKKKKKQAAAAANAANATVEVESNQAATGTDSVNQNKNDENQTSTVSDANDSTKIIDTINNNEQQPIEQTPPKPAENKPVQEQEEEKKINEDEKKQQTEENKNTENKDSENKEKKKDQDDGDYSDCDSDTDSDLVSDQELYTLMWKNKIPIALDQALKIKLVDFGNACWINKKFTDNIQTREYRAPETILGIDYEQNTDVFSLACMIYELITNDYLFKPKKRDGTSKTDEHLALLQESLGKFSKQFALSGTRSREYFNKNGQLIRIKDVEDYPISKILIREYDWDEKEAHDIEDFLLPMLNYNPKKRVQAKEALQHPWLWS